ncbi:MAG TPA: DUF2723 domain-containing protein [Anaerolineae bacterium]|nr:DUF2723 domain-containing protein [Anaerolineae bacterium]
MISWFNRKGTTALFLIIIPILYLATMARTLVLGDPTEYTFVANILGIAHPPGYAFITVLGHLWQKFIIPFGPIPWRMHLLSVTAGTLIPLLLYLTIRRATPDHPWASRLAAIFAALTVAVGANHWQHSLHTNPHIITALFLIFNLFCLTQWWHTQEKHNGWLYLFCLSTGLGVTHHPLTVFTFPAYTIFIIYIKPQILPLWRTLVAMAAFALLGLIIAIGLTIIVEANHWQDSLQTNSYIITALFLTFNLFCLAQWWYTQKEHNGWLYLFCLSLGLGVAYHPLPILTFSVYAIFIIYVRPQILPSWRALAPMVAFALLGLTVWLYFPWRSPQEPPFGPSDMATLDGFLNVALARGLRVNLFHFGLTDQIDRALVFWTLLRLQYTLPVIFLAFLGLPALWRRQLKHQRHNQPRSLALLYLLAFLCNYLFVINTVQDVMAYLIGPFLLVALFAGHGLYQFLLYLQEKQRDRTFILPLTTLALFLLGPALYLTVNLPHISLADYNEGQQHIDNLFTWFDDSGEQAILLHNWEFMTPVWYTQWVEERQPDPNDVRAEFVSAANPWLPSVFNYLPGGPVYINSYRREIVDAGFRLRPRGPFYQVVEPGDQSLPPELIPTDNIPETPDFPAGTPAGAPLNDLLLNGYLLPQAQVTAGDYVPLILAMSVPLTITDYYVPVITIGDQLTYAFTTDSHLPTPQWQPREIITERFDFALPFDMPAGRYPVKLQFQNLSQDQLSPTTFILGQLNVTSQPLATNYDYLLANFRQRVGLRAAYFNNAPIPNLLAPTRQAPWNTQFDTGRGASVPTVKRGNTLHLTLEWESLAPAEESYTIFVHLVDANHQPVIQPLDYTPLGGAAPTHLWIPKWLPGQRFLDPYQIHLPLDIPPGTYTLEVGLYEMTSLRRLHLADKDGNLAGDFYTLGSIIVE